MSGKIEISPCPFCGCSNLNTVEVFHGHHTSWATRCSCGIELDSGAQSSDEALSAWNKRATPVIERQEASVRAGSLPSQYTQEGLEKIRAEEAALFNNPWCYIPEFGVQHGVIRDGSGRVSADSCPIYRDSAPDGFVPLYRLPPAPVAVLPERKQYEFSSYDETSEEGVRQWNACLDKVKELNQ